MKVLLINNCHYRRGGSEAVYFNTAKLLKEHGHDVVFFSFFDEKNIKTGEKEYFIEAGGSIKKLVSYFYNSDAANKLDEILKDEKPDIAHSHLMWGGINQAIFSVLKKHNVPLVHTAHDYRLVCPAYTFKDGLGYKCERCGKWNYYQCALHRCNKGSLVQSIFMALEMYTRQLFHNPAKHINGFIFVSYFSERTHIAHHPSLKNTNHIVLYNYTHPILKPAISKKDNYFLYFGRLSHEKGIPTLLKVFACHPEWKLKVVGTGPLEDELKKKYVIEKDCKNIQFLGYHSGCALEELVRCAKFVCIPSEWYENNPMTILESYSLGTPVIGANIGGIPEIIDEGNTGYRFECRNVADLERVVKKASDISNEKYEEMCKKAYCFFQSHFSAHAYYESLIGFYRKIIFYSNYNK